MGEIHLSGCGPVFSHLLVCVCVCVVSLYRSRRPTFHLFCLSGHQFGPQPENLCPASAEGRSVITPRHTIKLLPRSDRWQLPEGLFIFCLLIRAAGERQGCRGGGRGGWERYTEEDEKSGRNGTPRSSGNINLRLSAAAVAV